MRREDIYKSVTSLVKEHVGSFYAATGKDSVSRRDYGTLIHTLIEKYLLGESVESEATEFRYFLSFMAEFREKLPEYSVIIPEQRLFDPVRKISGIADFVAIDSERRAILIDWKTCRKIYSYSHTGDKCKEPFQEMERCNLSEYRLQLNYYRSMLEEWYDVSVVLMMIVVFSSVNDRYLTYSVERIEIA